MAETKVIQEITINTRHELDLTLIDQYGGIPQERDLAMEAWDERPVEENLKILKQTMPKVRKILNNWFRIIDPDFKRLKL
jgi:hypothetical protein